MSVLDYMLQIKQMIFQQQGYFSKFDSEPFDLLHFDTEHLTPAKQGGRVVVRGHDDVLRGRNHRGDRDVLPPHTVINWLTAEFTFSFL